MVKWRLMLTTLPVVLLAVVVKLFVFDRLPLGSVLEFSDLAARLPQTPDFAHRADERSGS